MTKTPALIERNIPTLRELALAKLRDAILRLEFQPGDRLIERELQAYLGVSRTIVREVLRHLDAEGLVETIPHRGPIVAKPTPEQSQQIYELRALLEGLAASTCAERHSPQDIADLSEALHGIRDAYEQRPARDDVLAATTRFYHVLFHAAGKLVAWDFECTLTARINHLRAITTRTPGRDRTGPEAMAAIVEAIRAGRPEEAYRACVAHNQEASRLAQNYLNSIFEGGHLDLIEEQTAA